jgi:mono/diheme cytochrome c family protein
LLEEDIMASSIPTRVFLVLLLAVSNTLFAADAAVQFKQRCAPCHGPDGKGNTTIGKSLNIPDLTGADARKLSATELHQVVSEGRGSMPAFKGTVEAAEIKQLVTYIRTLQKPVAK